MRQDKIRNKGAAGRICVVMLLLFVMATGYNHTAAEASSAAITFSTSTPEVKKGDTFSVVLTINSKASIGDFEAYVFYDPDIMEFKTGGSFISGGDGLLRISDMNTETTDTVKKYSMKFKAKKIGACEVGLSDTAVAYDYDAGTEMSLSSNRLSISVISSAKLSSNSYLESLKISPGTISPEFESRIAEYTTVIPGDTEKLFVSAVPQDLDAAVTVVGNDRLKPGDNMVVVTVEAPSGDKKEYKLMVKMEESAASPQPETEEEDGKEEEAEEGFFTFTRDGSTYIHTESEYQVVEVPEGTAIPAGYMKTSLILNGITIDAYTPSQDLESDFLLLYVRNQDGTGGFYQYDRVEKTLQRYQQAVSGSTTTGTDKVLQPDDSDSRLQSLSVAIAILSATTVFLLLVVIRCYVKLRSGRQDDF